jgi:hypothetical protein
LYLFAPYQIVQAYLVKEITRAKNFPDKMEKYLKKECTYGAIIGPFFKNPFKTDMVISPLNAVPKKESEDRRIILYLSFGEICDFSKKTQPNASHRDSMEFVCKPVLDRT